MSWTMEEVFDIDWFIKTLKDDVKVMREVSEDLQPVFVGQDVLVEKPNYLTVDDCVSSFLPPLLQHRSIGLKRWHVQLEEDLPLPLQRLRCRVNFHALRFRPHIFQMGMNLVQTLQERGPYVAIHMRFEKDWLRYFGCLYDNSTLKAEHNAVLAAKMKSKGKLCPFSPVELKSILQAMGLNSSTPVYLAAGKVVDAKHSLRPLYSAFPGQVTSKAAMWRGDVDRLRQYGAIIDHLVALHSEILILGGGQSNWGHMVEGERFYTSGHTKETLVLSMRVLKPYLNEDPVDMEGLAEVVKEYRNSYRLTGCRREIDNSGSGFCYPLDCMCPL